MVWASALGFFPLTDLRYIRAIYYYYDHHHHSVKSPSVYRTDHQEDYNCTVLGNVWRV